MTSFRKIRWTLLSLVVAMAGVLVARAVASEPVLRLGAVYPTGGSHSRGGIDEYRGVQLAVEYVNGLGGVAGQQVEVILEPADSADQAPGAVRRLAARDVPVVLGSYGSTISRPAADVSASEGLVFWETGAVGELSMKASKDPLVFRFPPTGATLGRAAVEHAFERAIPALDRAPKGLRYGVTYVDDDYGRSVGIGAVDELRRRGVEPAGVYPYELRDDLVKLVASMVRDRIQVLFVSSYLSDGVEIRKQTIEQGLGLVASLGTSSSYCMHEFGEALGAGAVGLFASDKPDGHVLDPSRLDADAAERLVWARETFEERFKHEMTAPALTGFAGTIALLEHVLPVAPGFTAEQIAATARAVEVPVGGLPNGSGLDFDEGSENLNSTSVIWQWVAPGERAVVYPPTFATQAALPLRIS